jgi:hypothetical protein
LDAWLFHESNPLVCRLGGWAAAGLVEKRRLAVDFFVSNNDTKSRSGLNEALRYVRGDCLPLLVMDDVSLSAVQALGQRCLGQAKALSNGFDGVHDLHISGACYQCQQRRLLFFYERQ